ncbi:MAG: D-alanyl-D-alanine carboxypeptidase [Oscillospiraceae bacterium]|nr:D-alanyl-D-alanine carboxypeptidase [Oscillospiraceae bacterium]
MKKSRGICLLLAVVVLLQWVAVPVDGAQTDSLAVLQGCVTLDGQAPLAGSEQLLDTAKSVILYELDSDTLVYSWNPDERLDPSGMNKIMTALLAIEQTAPEDMVTVTREALNSVAIGSMSAGLKAGEQLSMKDLLYCMMVGSANDAAAVIAAHISGDQDTFAALMNTRAAELGCTDTNFMNANGLSHEQQYSTARDLAKITKAALELPLFVELFGAVEYTVAATEKSEAREIFTTNYLMSTKTVRNQYDERVTGGKTGALSTTDRSLIATAESGGSRYLSVVMSAKGTVTGNGLSVKTFGSFEETRALLDIGFEGYAVRQLLSTDRVMDQFSVDGGENDVIGRPGANLIAALPVDASPLDVTYKCVPGDIKAPLTEGQTIGTVEVWFRDVCVGQCDLIAMFAVEQPGVYTFNLAPTAAEAALRAWTTWLLIGGIALLAVVLIWFAVVLIRHRIRIIKIERRHKLISGEKKKRRRRNA